MREAWRATLAAHEKRGSLAGLTAAEEALSAFPEDPEFLAAKGRQLTLLRRFDEAEACLVHALSLSPEDPAVLLHLAQLYVGLGRYEEACGHIDTAVASGRPGEATLVRAGRLLHGMGQHLEAAVLIARALAQHPASSAAGFQDAAIAAVDEDAQAGATPADKVLLRQGMERLRRREPELAEPLFAELTRRSKGFALGWLGLRGALEAQGRTQEACSLLGSWRSVHAQDHSAMGVVFRRKLSARGLVFDARDGVPIRRMSDGLRRAAGGPDLLSEGDSWLAIEPGGVPVAHDPVVSLDETGRDILPVRYRTAPKFLASLQNAALVGAGLVLTEQGHAIEELIPPTRTAKYEAAREADRLVFDPARFRDGMMPVRIIERPALLMCGPTDASFGDWIINFPPRLAIAEAAGLGDVAVVVGRPPQAQALAILAALGVGPERIVFHDREGVSLLSRLLVPSWPTPDKFAPSAGIYEVYRRAAVRSPYPKRPLLYLTRKNVSSRPMLNEDAVIDLFRRRGFQAVDPGSLSFDEVRELFADPACVAGPFGSAFHNLAFTSGNPVSLVLLPDHTRHHLEEIAVWHGDLGLRFAYLWGNAVGAETGKAKRHAPWTAPLERLDHAIEVVLAFARQTPI